MAALAEHLDDLQGVGVLGDMNAERFENFFDGHRSLQLAQH